MFKYVYTRAHHIKPCPPYYFFKHEPQDEQCACMSASEGLLDSYWNCAYRKDEKELLRANWKIVNYLIIMR